MLSATDIGVNLTYFSVFLVKGTLEYLSKNSLYFGMM